MKNYRSWLLMFAAVVGMMMVNSVPSTAAEHNHGMKVGKKGDVTFTQETRVGDLTLKPGRYIFRHRVQGEDHFVSFTTPGGEEVGEVKCRLEPLSKKVEATTLYQDPEGGVYRITKIEVGGENVAHLF